MVLYDRKHNAVFDRILRSAVSAALIMTFVCGCGGKKDSVSSDASSAASQGADASSDTASAAPATLEQELLSRRGIAFDASDYKKFTGGDGVLSLDTVFADMDPTYGSSDSSSVFIANGSIYKFRCETPLAGGVSCTPVFSLPVTSKPVYVHTRDVNGADIDVIFDDGKRFSFEAVTNDGPYTAKESQYGSPYFEHTYKYSADGKSLDEISGFKSTVRYFNSRLCVSGDRLYAYARRQVRDTFFDGAIYSDDKNNGFMIWDVNCSAMQEGERVLTVFCGNIVVTDRAFYKVVYDDIPENLIDRTARATNSDGTLADYLPKFGGGDRYRLEKLELLSKYYDEVATITQNFVITKDGTLLPLTEIIPTKNKYTSYSFGDIEIPEDVSDKID